ncbi:LacI family DNA-binding transcriptional regulator [Seongchinamella sediminis]|uniref:LacI family DNA-binding transcriptional regulator n=1 Tax=Seongchinamella sediminis TaxID=2283635 RepID=A0A3L7DW26_9GAMM|nr:LacI family DNA-binding transcriptional regulator [Seongchinamella sediminis]RLQ21326.1 LacI family DNA-binding transcriptional regulator [Seongchinamella sediminis]
MKATIKDVAKLAGVSFKTVSRVINREPSVGEDLQAKVWAAIEELNYQPNLSARQLRGAASFIAFIYDNPNSHYVIEMQHGILEECKRQGFELLIHPTDSGDGNYVDELRQLVSNGHVAGLVLTPPFSESARLIEALESRGMSHVRILSGGGDSEGKGPRVLIDDYHAAYDITRYLVELGHRDIAFLGGHEEHDSSSEQRLKGYLAALADAGLPRRDELILPGSYNFDSGSERTSRLLGLDSTPSAIFACNDEIAAGALFAARIRQVAVPQQLSIVGFEDSPFSRQTWPKLTTAHQPNSEIAAAAARVLIESIRAARHGSDEPPGASLEFKPELVIRDSTCPAPL